MKVAGKKRRQLVEQALVMLGGSKRGFGPVALWPSDYTDEESESRPPGDRRIT